MNAELSAAGLCRVMVPMSYRDEYMSALRALSQNDNPTPLWRMIDRAQRVGLSLMPWTGHDRAMRLMSETNALVTPDDARELNLRLLDPALSPRASVSAAELVRIADPAEVQQ